MLSHGRHALLKWSPNSAANEERGCGPSCLCANPGLRSLRAGGLASRASIKSKSEGGCRPELQSARCHTVPSRAQASREIARSERVVKEMHGSFQKCCVQHLLRADRAPVPRPKIRTYRMHLAPGLLRSQRLDGIDRGSPASRDEAADQRGKPEQQRNAGESWQVPRADAEEQLAHK
jgi:hypothetical protein